MKKYIANIITGCRILCSILMLFLSALSAEFYILYLFCGFSDMIDGTVARKTSSISEFGGGFDTVADFIFLSVSLFKFSRLIRIPEWLWIWIGIISIIKISGIIWGFICRKKLISLHTIMNKITGVLLFLLPCTFHFFELKYSLAVVCLVATISAIQEGFLLQGEGKGN